MLGSRDPLQSEFRKVWDQLRKQSGAIAALENDAQRRAAQARYTTTQGTSEVDDLRKNELHYANVILLLGYGGFFALWSSCADRMHPATFGLLGLSMGISLLAFVAFELIKTLSNSVIHNKAARKDAHGHRLMSDSEYLRQLRDVGDRVNAKWIWFFVPAVVFGLGAGMGLLIFFVRLTLQA